MASRRARLGAALVFATIAAASGWYSPGPLPAEAQESETDLFDKSFVHDVEVAFDQAEYDAMIETFRQTGEKDWIEATITIDGETFEEVGMRLKGNSSLFGLRFGFPGGPGGDASADEPEGLPWLIRWDKFIKDQEPWGGRQYLAIRSNPSETSLNEAVAMDLLAEARLPFQKAMATSFSVNGSDAVLRLGLEIPDDDVWQDDWEEAILECKGGVYKAKSGGNWSYRGDDPELYDEDIFEQKGGKSVADMTPLIDFLRFINTAEGAIFAAELRERFDVDAFATYLATSDLFANWDDIDGPGNNAYVLYDTCTEQITIVPWDYNLTFGVGFGGGGPGGGGPPGFPGRVNPLVEKFHADPEFEALYQQKRTELRASLFESGAAEEILDSWVGLLMAEATHLVDAATITSEADAIRGYFTAQCFTATNTEHVMTGRATSWFYVLFWANGSDTFLGFSSQTTSLREGPPGTWNVVASC